jgi:hypothetical protein
MSVYVDPSIPRYTRRDLLDDMAERGFDFSAAAMRDWQAKGLVADANQDRRWADGRPGSDAGLWSDNQRKSLAALLGLRDRSQAEPGALDGIGNAVTRLGNVVVWWWVYWDGIVELPQVRKALRTWVRPMLGGPAGGARSQDRVRKGTRAMVRSLSAPGTSRATRTRVSDRLADLYWTDNQDGLDTLVTDMRALVDPARTGRTIGSALQPVGPDEVARAVDATIRAAHAVVTGSGSLLGSDWDFARTFLREAWAEYHRDWHALDATALDTAVRYEQPDVGLQVREASRGLLTVLGLRVADRAALGL